MLFAIEEYVACQNLSLQVLISHGEAPNGQITLSSPDSLNVSGCSTTSLLLHFYGHVHQHVSNSSDDEEIPREINQLVRSIRAPMHISDGDLKSLQSAHAAFWYM